MSRSQVFVVKENGDVEHLTDTKSPYGPSLIIWYALAQKYSLDFRPHEGILGGVEKLAYQPNLPLFERISLILTIEGIWIRREHLITVINALEDFTSINVLEEYRPELRDLATVMRQVFTLSDCIGIAFNMVGDATPFWHVYEKLPDTETEDAALRKYNVFKDKGHIEISVELCLPADSFIVSKPIDE